MCRWLAYSGSPLLLKEALYGPANSLIEQSLHSRLGAETTNGDGFGVGWYGALPTPGVFHSTEPAWNDKNLHELADHISSSNFFAHIRAAIGSSVQQTNCHPFRHDRWLFMHNGYIDELATIKRDLVLAVDPSLYPQIAGHDRLRDCCSSSPSPSACRTTRPPRSSAPSDLWRTLAGRHRVANPFQGTIATTNGETIWAFRYSSEGKSRSLFYTTDVPTLRKLYPERELYEEVSEDAHMVVSEPLGEIPGVWNEVPEATCRIVGHGRDELRPFRPQAP